MHFICCSDLSEWELWIFSSSARQIQGNDFFLCEKLPRERSSWNGSHCVWARIQGLREESKLHRFSWQTWQVRSELTFNLFPYHARHLCSQVSYIKEDICPKLLKPQAKYHQWLRSFQTVWEEDFSSWCVEEKKKEMPCNSIRPAFIPFTFTHVTTTNFNLFCRDLCDRIVQIMMYM